MNFVFCSVCWITFDAEMRVQGKGASKNILIVLNSEREREKRDEEKGR